jgi:succinate-acetate transporter protein
VTVTVLETAFWLLAVSEFVDNPMLKVAGGYLGIMSAFGAWYIAAATVITPDTSYFVLPIGDLSRGRSHSD